MSRLFFQPACLPMNCRTLLLCLLACSFFLCAQAQKGGYPEYETYFDALIARVRYNPELEDLAGLKAQFPYLVTVTIFFDEIDQFGNMVPESRALIEEKEPRFVLDVADRLKGIYSGSFEYLGDYNLYFYVGDTSLVRSIAPLLPVFGMDLSEITVRSDKGWSNYFNFLAPTATDKLRMDNTEQIYTLAGAGDQVYTPREVIHKMHFAHDLSRTIFIKEAQKLDFEILNLYESEDRQHPAGIRIVRFDPVDPERVEETTMRLYSICVSLKGEYLGWDTEPVLKEPETGQ